MVTQTIKQHRKLLLASSISLAIAAMGNVYAAEPMSKDEPKADMDKAEYSNQISSDRDAMATSRNTSKAQAESGLPVAEQVSNARQESQISTTFALSPYLGAHDIKVSVQDGKATLTGIVDEEVNKELAEEIAQSVEGIKDVDNKIEVQADHVAAKQSSSENNFGQIVADASISAAVKSKLAWSKHAQAMSTKVETKQGKVTLSGTVDSQQAKDHANRLAINTRGVESVNNKLVVEAAKAKANDSGQSSDAGSSAESDQPIADTWITTKVKATFIYSSNVDSSDISVTTINGVVNLSGNVQSGAEQDLAIQLASNIRGVTSVDSEALQVGSPVAAR